MPKRVTLQDIANEAGVHQSTVYHALRAETGRKRVDPDTVARIEAAAKKLGYRPPGNEPTYASMARDLGISHTAVSMAFREGTRISDELRTYIKAYAEKVGFQP